MDLWYHLPAFPCRAWSPHALWAAWLENPEAQRVARPIVRSGVWFETSIRDTFAENIDLKTFDTDNNSQHNHRVNININMVND